jgi:hypothetical protein
MIKGIERVTPTRKFDLRGVDVKLRGVRQDRPPRMISIDHELIVDTDETDQRLELLHTNVRRYGTIANSVAVATKLEGMIKRKAALFAGTGRAVCRGSAPQFAPLIHIKAEVGTGREKSR